MLYGDDPLKLNNYTYAPSLAAIIQSGNLYVYAMNNPTRYTDPDGEFTHLAIGVAVGAAINGGLNFADQLLNGKKVNLKELAASVAGGAVIGLATAAGANAVISSVIAGSVDIVTQAAGNNWDYSKVDVAQAVTGVALGAVGSAGADLVIGPVNTKHLGAMGKNMFDRVMQVIGTGASLGDEFAVAHKYYKSQATKETNRMIWSMLVSTIPEAVDKGYQVYSR